MPPTFGTRPRSSRRSWPAARARSSGRRKASRTTTRKAARSIGRLRLTKKDVVIGVSASGMTPFVRGGLTRARKAGARIIFVTCWPGSELQNFVDLHHRAGGRPGDHRRLDAAQGRHRDQDGAQHADHRRDDQARQDLRQPDGRRPDRLGEAQGSRAPDPRRRDRPRATTHADALLKRAQVERQGGDRHAEGRPDAAAGAEAAEARRTTRSARRSARTSSRACASCSSTRRPV